MSKCTAADAANGYTYYCQLDEGHEGQHLYSVECYLDKILEQDKQIARLTRELSDRREELNTNDTQYAALLEQNVQACVRAEQAEDRAEKAKRERDEARDEAAAFKRTLDKRDRNLEQARKTIREWLTTRSGTTSRSPRWCGPS